MWRPVAVIPSAGRSNFRRPCLRRGEYVRSKARRTINNERQQQKNSASSSKTRKAEIEDDVSYMANEMRSIGVDQDDENGSLGNHIADDGSNVTEAERIVTVTEDLQ